MLGVAPSRRLRVRAAGLLGYAVALGSGCIVAGGITAESRVTGDAARVCEIDAVSEDGAVARTGFVQVTAGDDHTCALHADGRVFCWGANALGQLGVADLQPRLVPTLVAQASPASIVVAGREHTCARSKEVLCWGANDVGQLGGDSTARCGARACDPSGVRFPPNATSAELLAVGGVLTCVSSGQNIQCRGRVNAAGSPPFRDPPYNFLEFGARQLVSGYTHSCALLPYNDWVMCWGFGPAYPGPPSRNLPDRVSGITRPADLVAGGTHGCARSGCGEVLCWGGNEYGELGDGTTTDRAIAAVVPGLTDVARVWAGARGNCAITGDGAVSCWGDNRAGQLGVASAGDSCRDGADCALRPRAFPALAGVRAVALGARHGCALDVAGRVSCWGANDQGQLGDGTNTSRLAPVPVATP